MFSFATVRCVRGSECHPRRTSCILLCDYQHRDGSSLHVRSPGTETVVVGTLFSIEVAATGSAVSVAHGSVDVVARGQKIRITGGHRLLPNGHALETLAGAAAEELAEHEAALLPPQGEAGVLSVVAESEGSPIWLGGRWVGTAPLSARLTSGRVALLVGQPGARPSVAGRSHVRQIETLVLPGKTAVALIDSNLTEKANRVPTPGRNETASHTREAVRSKLPETPAMESPQEITVAHGAEETPAVLYKRAEAAMRKGEKEDARRMLQTLVDRFPDGEFASSARYEMARMAFASGDWQGARRGLDRLQETKLIPALIEPVHYLRCRVEIARADRGRALACLSEFRATFPGSPHDAEMLSLLASFRFEEKCTSALPLLEEYLRRYPQGPFAREAQKRRQHCQP